MNRQQFHQRMNKLLAEESKNPLSWWYLSYADDDGFRGAVIIQAHGVAEAAYMSAHRGLSPGGEIMILPIPEENLPPEEHRSRLLTRAELDTIWGGDLATLEEFEEEEGSCPCSE